MKVKICGLTRPSEAEYLNENHVDYAGMVLFCPKSRRNISTDLAKEIISSLDPSVRSVAVTVSPNAGQIRTIYDAGFDYIQIHGSFPDHFPADVNLPIFKAFNVNDLPMLGQYLLNDAIKGFVMDAHTPGSGKTFDWDLVKDLDLNGRLLILAGGLDPSNVKNAVSYVHPDVVDVSTGVEFDDRPGKDPEKIKAFVSSACSP